MPAFSIGMWWQPGYCFTVKESVGKTKVTEISNPRFLLKKILIDDLINILINIKSDSTKSQQIIFTFIYD